MREQLAEGPFPPHPRGLPGALSRLEHHWKHGPQLYWHVTRPLWYLRWRLWSRSARRGKPWKGTRAAEGEGRAVAGAPRGAEEAS